MIFNYNESHDLDTLNRIFPNLNSNKRNYLLLIFILNLNFNINCLNKTSERSLAREVLKCMPFEWRNDGNACVEYIDELMLSVKIDDLDFEIITQEKFIGHIVDYFINDFFVRGNFGENIKHDMLFYFETPFTKNPFLKYQFPASEKIKIFFDAARCSLDLKRKEFERLKFKINDAKNKYRRLDWFDNKEKLDAAHDFFRKKYLGFNTNFLTLDDVKSHFYLNFLDNEDYIELAFKKISALYGNRKNRNSSVTKQANFSLSKKSIKNIDKLSMEYRVTKSKIIDIAFSNDLILNEIKNKLMNLN